MLRYMNTNADVWHGWTYWAAGAWWGGYPMSIEPVAGTDRAQMAVLRRYTQSSQSGGK
jgi:endoglucanase